MEFTSDLKVELVQHTGSDAFIASAARVSTGAELESFEAKKDAGLINYLMKKRHGSPFEHGSMTFRIEAPIFVFREFQRHRVGWSYNEVSGRYKKLEPKFYTYPEGRPLVQAGSGAHPDLVHGDEKLHTWVNGSIQSSARKAWREYEAMLELGVANEVARAVLPVTTFSSMYATCNPRSLMAFLSLRVDAENNQFETKPQWEIQRVAEEMGEHFADLFPATEAAFEANGRVSP